MIVGYFQTNFFHANGKLVKSKKYEQRLTCIDSSLNKYINVDSVEKKGVKRALDVDRMARFYWKFNNERGLKSTRKDNKQY